MAPWNKRLEHPRTHQYRGRQGLAIPGPEEPLAAVKAPLDTMSLVEMKRKTIVWSRQAVWLLCT